MSRTARRGTTASLIGVVALTAALAGCGELIVLNPGSLATCVPAGDPVTLTTSQDAAGELLTITYEGPSDLALVFSYGYSLEDVPEAETGAYAYSNSQSGGDPTSDTAYLLRLDPATDPGWTSTESGGILEATFEGNVEELLDGRNAFLTFGQGTAIVEVASAFVAVNCNTEFASGDVETVDSDPTLAPDLLLAAPLNPDTVRLGPFIITGQSTVGGVTTGTLRFAEDAAETFGSFVPYSIAESTVVADVADVPDDTFSQLWFQEFIRDAENVGTFEITSPLTLAGEMDFTFTTSSGTEPLPSGLHRLRIVFGNTDLVPPSLGEADAVSSEFGVQQAQELDLSRFTPAAAGDAKAAFFDVEYDAVTGLSIGAVAEENAEPELADTGSSVDGAAFGVAALLVVGGVAALAGRRVRRA